jgi:hypothetical protein
MNGRPPEILEREASGRTDDGSIERQAPGGRNVFPSRLAVARDSSRSTRALRKAGKTIFKVPAGRKSLTPRRKDARKSKNRMNLELMNSGTQFCKTGHDLCFS